jgi:hypothetical protein
MAMIKSAAREPVCKDLGPGLAFVYIYDEATLGLPSVLFRQSPEDRADLQPSNDTTLVF